MTSPDTTPWPEHPINVWHEFRYKQAGTWRKIHYFFGPKFDVGNSTFVYSCGFDRQIRFICVRPGHWVQSWLQYHPALPETRRTRSRR